jgi:hypothetical protein
MNYLIDSITEYFKENPFSMDNMDIVPYKTAPSMNKGIPLPDETKKLISETKTGKKHSEQHKKAVSDGLKGHVISEETKRKISASLKGRNINTSRCISIKTPTGTFPSTNQAAKAYGVSKPTVKTWALENKNGFSIIQD